jgi:group I intron endonuclease
MIKSGIYKITCTANNKFYIGSSKDIHKRLSKHKSQLKFNRHENILLQRAYNKYGSDSFTYKAIEEVEPSLLLMVEQKYLDEYPPFNIGKTASGGDNLTNHPDREYIIQRITNTLNEKIKNMSAEERSEKWGKNMESNPNWRGGSSYIYCNCGQRIGYGHKQCMKCYDKSGENNPFYGKTHSKETMEKIKKTKKENYKNSTPEERAKRNPQIRKVNINGTLYFGVSEAARQLGVSAGTICHRIKSPNPKYKDYHYVD